jgi:hypothetical protein
VQAQRQPGPARDQAEASREQPGAIREQSQTHVLCVDNTQEVFRIRSIFWTREICHKGKGNIREREISHKGKGNKPYGKEKAEYELSSRQNLGALIVAVCVVRCQHT